MRFLFLALLLAGCATTPKIVRVPVATSCVTGDIPAEPPTISDKLTGNAEHDVGMIGASAIRLRSWGRELVAMLGACR